MFMTKDKRKALQVSGASNAPVAAQSIGGGVAERQVSHVEAGLFAYVGADPINFTDPLGLMSYRECQRRRQLAEQGIGDDIWVCGPDPNNSSFWRGRGPDPDLYRERIADALDRFAERYLRPPPARQKNETYAACVFRIVSPENAAVGAAAVELGRGNPALYPRGAPSGASGTSYISTTVRAIEKALGGGGLAARGEYWFGARTLGGAIGRGVSSAYVATGTAVISLEIGKAGGAVQVCR